MSGTLLWHDQHRPPMTVGELRVAIAHLPDDMPCAGDSEGRVRPLTDVDVREYSPHVPVPFLALRTAPVTPGASPLSSTQQAFCREYLVDLNATQAYRRANPSQAPESANANAYRLMVNDGVRAEIQRLMDERAVITGFAADRVLCKWITQATADPRELAMVRVGSCRYCWGLGHQHQYTVSEWEKVVSEHEHKQARARNQAQKAGLPFEGEDCPCKGGTGYMPNRPPNPECPECFGDGQPRVVLRDQSKLSPGALALFGGFKSGKNGLQIIFTESRQHALDQIALHLGMLKGDGRMPIDDPLEKLLEEIQGAHGAGSTLPVVWHPEEDPDDVVSRPTSHPEKSALSADASTQQPLRKWRKT